MRSTPVIVFAALALLGAGVSAGYYLGRPPKVEVNEVVVERPSTAPPAYAARAQRLLDAAAEREPFLPLQPEEDARAALKSLRQSPRVPPLTRIGLAAPRTMDAEMGAWETLKGETSLDAGLLDEVFYVVSSQNECGYCMGHLTLGKAPGSAARDQVFAADDTEHQDPKRKAMFTFARHMAATPPAVTREDISALRKHLNDRQIVELTFFVGRFDLLNRLAEAWGVPLERALK